MIVLMIMEGDYVTTVMWHGKSVPELSLYLITMVLICRGLKVKTHVLTSALDKGEWSAFHALAALLAHSIQYQLNKRMDGSQCWSTWDGK